MRKRAISIAILTVFAVAVFTATASADMQSPNYRITTSVISGGGGPMASDNFLSQSTLGQPSPISPPLYSLNFSLYPGFWYTLVVGTGNAWDLDRDGDVDGVDLWEFKAGFETLYDATDLAAFALEFGSVE
jgi:hypothetical protein